jgi:hypothetical protein
LNRESVINIATFILNEVGEEEDLRLINLKDTTSGQKMVIVFVVEFIRVEFILISYNLRL